MKNVPPISHPPGTQHPGAHNQPVGPVVTPEPVHASHVPHNANLDTPSPSDNAVSMSTKTKLIVGLSAIFGIIMISLGVNFLLSNNRSEEKSQPEKILPINIVPSEVVVTVGNEQIFQIDIQKEIAFYPKVVSVNDPKVQAALLEKIKEDSIILQELANPEDLSPDVFNSIFKDYEKRMTLVSKLKNRQQEKLSQESAISGKIISIWYYNINEPTMDIEQAREIAQSKLSTIREEISQNALTVDQAIERIQNDTSLQNLDTNYRGNAFADFSILNTEAGSQTRFSPPELYANVLEMEVGEVSPIFEAIIAPEERYFLFAIVTSRPDSLDYSDYQSWLDSVKKKYVQ